MKISLSHRARLVDLYTLSQFSYQTGSGDKSAGKSAGKSERTERAHPARIKADNS